MLGVLALEERGGVLYSTDRRRKAIETLMSCDLKYADAVAKLGYPSIDTLRAWWRDYEEAGSVPEGRYVRDPKYGEEMKRAAVDHYLAHGRNASRTMRELGYPQSRAKLVSWIDELAPGKRKRRGGGRAHASSQHESSRGDLVPDRSIDGSTFPLSCSLASEEATATGRYVNPGLDGFRAVVQGEYVDKTGMIALMNAVLGTMRKLVLVSRPRRFGKSFAAAMLSAYYSCGCDAHELFAGLDISRDPSFEKHLNAYNVVFLDMAEVIHVAGAGGVGEHVARLLLPELRLIVPRVGRSEAGSGDKLMSALYDVVRETDRKFVFVIDEWDAVYRLATDDRSAQDSYADWLRALFRGGTFTNSVIAGAYLTGILPRNRSGDQSSVSDFCEYSVIRQGDFAPYAGFAQHEVEELCRRHGMDFSDMRRWYDGYDLSRAGNLYAPFSVMEACLHGKTGSYWVSTEARESLRPYIEMDIDGLQTDIVRAIGGESLRVDADAFQNDLSSIRVKDDVLTLLVHYGYLTYDAETETVRIPNEEVRAEVMRSVRRSDHPKLRELIASSERLLDDIVNLREEAVAAQIAHVHERDCSPLFYNNEQALVTVVRTALVVAVDEYERVELLSGGRGLVDIAYIPRRGSMLPALLVEMKWDRPVPAVLDQIGSMDNPEVMRGLDVPIVLVGITYEPKTKKHCCRIEVQDGQ